MIDLSIAQAIFEGDLLRARSYHFSDSSAECAVKLIQRFGAPQPESTCTGAIFARPLGTDRVAVVQVAGPPTLLQLRFRFIVVGRELYHFLHDPFAVAERFPPDWAGRDPLPDLEWPAEPLPRRTVAQLDAILKHGDGPFLLGASQTLVDGGKIALNRVQPLPGLLRDLWALLPDSSRRIIWPATFAFCNDLRFDLVVLPKIPSPGLPGYLGEEQARDYPDSRYERQLQTAIESGDQATLDRLLARRTSSEMLRFAMLMVVLAFGITAIVKALTVLKLI